MKATGIVRKVDSLGRVVIPMELRKIYGIELQDPMEILVDDGNIILRKYEAKLTCAVTGETDYDNMQLAGGKVTLSKAGAKQLMEEIKANM